MNLGEWEKIHKEWIAEYIQNKTRHREMVLAHIVVDQLWEKYQNSKSKRDYEIWYNVVTEYNKLARYSGDLK